MDLTAFKLAERFIGLREVQGKMSNTHILAMLQLDAKWVIDDETPWCSAFVNYVCWLLRLPRSKKLSARSWLAVGTPIHRIEDAKIGFDVIVLQRGTGKQPGPEVLDAPGHVGFYAGHHDGNVYVLGGNQGDTISVAPFKVANVLGIRRLQEAA